MASGQLPTGPLDERARLFISLPQSSLLPSLAQSSPADCFDRVQAVQPIHNQKTPRVSSRSPNNTMELRYLLAISFLCFQFADCLVCPDSSNPKIFEYADGECFYIYQSPTPVTEMTREEAEDACLLLGENSTNWHLPKLDTDSKSRKLAEAITNVTGMTHWMTWLGLHRVSAMNVRELTNATLWADQSKWYWTSDGISLEYSYANSSAPWLPNEPSNRLYQEGAHMRNLERCAIVEMNRNRKLDAPKWYDMTCHVRAAQFIWGAQHLESYVSVCDSSRSPELDFALLFISKHLSDELVQCRQNHTTTPDPTITSITTEAQLKWLATGMVCGVLCGAITLVAVYYLVRQRKLVKKREVIKMEFRNEDAADGQHQQVAQWIGGDTSVNDDKEKFFD